MPNFNTQLKFKLDNFRFNDITEYVKFIEFVKPQHHEEIHMKNLLLNNCENGFSYKGYVKKTYDNYMNMIIHRSYVNRSYKQGGDTGHKYAQIISFIFLDYLKNLADDEFYDKICFDMENLKDMEDSTKNDNEIFNIVRRKSKKQK